MVGWIWWFSRSWTLFIYNTHSMVSCTNSNDYMTETIPHSTSYPLPFFYIIRLIILSTILLIFEYDKSIKSIELLWFYIVFYICLIAGESQTEKNKITNLIIATKNTFFFASSFIDKWIMHMHSVHAWIDSRDKQKIFDAILAVSQIK